MSFNGEDVHQHVRYSVIVPVFKIDEGLLLACLNSLKTQNYDAVEYIIVDDGSPDGCGVICDQFATDSRFRIVHKVNEGVSSARNFGINLAHGDYVLFVDGDDRIGQGIFSILDACIESRFFDLAFFGFDFLDDAVGLPSCRTLVWEKEEPTVDEIAIAIASGSDAKGVFALSDIVYGTPWGKVFRRDFLIKLGAEFPVGIKKRQDAVFMLEVLAAKPSLLFIPFAGYGYVQRRGSVCHEFNPVAEEMFESAFCAIEKAIAENYVGSRAREMSEALDALSVKMIFEFSLLGTAHPNCPQGYVASEQKFASLCKRYQVRASRCKLHYLPDNARKVVALCFKAHCYGAAFLLAKIASRAKQKA